MRQRLGARPRADEERRAFNSALSSSKRSRSFPLEAGTKPPIPVNGAAVTGSINGCNLVLGPPVWYYPTPRETVFQPIIRSLGKWRGDQSGEKRGNVNENNTLQDRNVDRAGRLSRGGVDNSIRLRAIQ